MSRVEDPRTRRAALERAIASRASELATPALVIDLDAVEHNVAAMVGRLGDAGRWRPHVKTVKQRTIVGILLDAGVHRFKAATAAEVELVLRAASDRALARPVEVLLAYPATPPQLGAMLELRRAHPEAALGLLADDPEHAHALASDIGRPSELMPFDLWLDVDVGMHRTGSPPSHWAQTPLPSSPWLRPMGLHGYDGHLRWNERDAAHAGYDALVELAHALPFAVEQIVTSGTHSYAHALEHTDLRDGAWIHQVSPGTIVLSDRRSGEAARDLGLRQAAFVLSRVVARPGDDRITLDAGSKALAPDCPAPGCGVLGESSFEPLTASEEHRPVRVSSGPRPERGQRVWLVPDHVCTTVNLHAEALYVRTDAIVGSAPVEARGHRPWLGLGVLLLAAGLGSSTGCSPIVTEVDVQLLLPPDPTDLDRTNNVSVVLEPDGFADTIVADGLDFVLSFERLPDVTARTLAIYLAEDDELLAWGRTPPFTYGGVGDGLTLLVARPGALEPLDLEFAEADALARAASVSELGVLVLASDGSALFLDAYRYTLQAAASLPTPPALADGALVGAPDGAVLWVTWGDGPAAWRFDPLEDDWTELSLGGDATPRPGAASLLDAEAGTLRLLGGGETDDVVELSLVGDEPRDVVTVAGLRLDGPRQGATAARLDSNVLVIGGDDSNLPTVWRADARDGAGPTGSWTSVACAPRSESSLLCPGGDRDGAPTADALLIEVGDAALTVEALPALLPAALPDPLVLSDDSAIYAQGAGRWFRIDRSDLSVSEPPGASERADGGDAVRLPGGATLVVGGRDVDGVALSRWTVFAPVVAP